MGGLEPQCSFGRVDVGSTGAEVDEDVWLVLKPVLFYVATICNCFEFEKQ
jgi:hypothetical protein